MTKDNNDVDYNVDVSLSMKNIPLVSNERSSECLFWIIIKLIFSLFRYNRRKEWSTFNADKTDESFHAKFLAEFLENKTKLLNLNEFDMKPKCRVEVNKKFSLTTEDENVIETLCLQDKKKFGDYSGKPLILAPNFDPFAFYVKDIPNCVVIEDSYLMYEEVR